MNEKRKTKEQLIRELEAVRRRLSELENSVAGMKEPEESIKESEGLYRTLIETSPDPIILYDLNGKILAANMQTAVTYGVSTVEEFLSAVETVFDLLMDEGRTHAAANFGHTLTTGSSQKNEYQVRVRDGRCIDVEINSSVVRSATGEPQAFISVIRDITDRKRTEVSLREAKQRLDAHFENSPVAIVEFDPAFRVIRWSGEAEKVFGWSGDEIIGKTNGDFQWVYEDDVSVVINVSKDMLSGIRPKNLCVNRNYRKDGSVIYCEWYNSAIYNENGKLSSILSIILDVTERKRTEDALQESEERYRTFVDKANDIVFRTDNTGHFLYVNPAALRITGYREEEVIGKHFSDFIRPDRRGEAVRFYGRQFLKGLQNTYMEYPVLAKDGHDLWFGQNTQLIVEEGRAVGFQALARDITDRIKAETALKESEERYKNFVEKSFAGVYVVQDGVFLFVNRTAAGIAGYEPEGLMGKQSNSLIHPEDQAGVHENVKNMLRGEALSPYEFRIVAKDGRIRWVMETVTSIQHGGKRAILGNSTDITDLKRSQMERERAEYLYRTLTKHAQSAVFIVQDGRFRFVNPYVILYSGYEESALIGMDAVSLIHPEDRENARRNAARMLKGEALSPYEFRIINKHGDTRWILEVCTAVDFEGKPAVLMNSMDITERRRAEERSRQSEEKFSTIFMTAPDCIAITRIEDGLILEVNLGFEEITGWKRNEAAGMTSTQMNFWVDPAARDYMVEELKAGRDILNREFLFRCKDGSVRSGIYSARPLTIAGERCLIFILQDITDRLQLEDERQKLEQQLVQAQKLEAIGTLAGGIAHDFNNLLMGIQGYASLTLLDLDPSHPHYERITRIEEQVRKGTDLTRQLLGFARGGRYEVKPSGLNKIIAKTSAMFGRTRKEITIHHQFAEDLWTVEVDQGQMDQVFMNLYLNAWQAMPGGGELFLETGNAVLSEEQTFSYSFKPGRYVKILVRDTGVGMDEKTRERIFDPFFTTKGMGRGTGLGLATVYGIIKGHKGFIDVDSVSGQGTTFTIYLPASDKEIMEEPGEAGTITKGGETILIVDDEQMVLDVTKELLESMGYRVHTAGNGKDAVDVYQNRKGEIDLVILDMIMPGMSGGETFDRLHEINPGIKTLLSSGYSINGQAQEILDRGCNGFIQKPFLLKNLSRKVREILD
jgi:PAS domain S-box-containing protein